MPAEGRNSYAACMLAHQYRQQDIDSSRRLAGPGRKHLRQMVRDSLLLRDPRLPYEYCSTGCSSSFLCCIEASDSTPWRPSVLAFPRISLRMVRCRPANRRGAIEDIASYRKASGNCSTPSDPPPRATTTHRETAVSGNESLEFRTVGIS